MPTVKEDDFKKIVYLANKNWTPYFSFVCLGERKNMNLGKKNSIEGSGRSYGRKKNINKINCMKFLKNK